MHNDTRCDIKKPTTMIVGFRIITIQLTHEKQILSDMINMDVISKTHQLCLIMFCVMLLFIAFMQEKSNIVVIYEQTLITMYIFVLIKKNNDITNILYHSLMITSVL